MGERAGTEEGGSLAPGTALAPRAAQRLRPRNSFVSFPIEETAQSISARFEAQVCRYPQRIAVKTPQQELTYAVLNEAANRVARALRARRMDGESWQPEPIALLLEHDASLIVALLAVLKAGKIHVPLDPAYPRARLLAMLADSQAGLIITNGRTYALACALAGDTQQVLNLDEIDSAERDSGSNEDLDLVIPPDAFSYILYTSGSTGAPKGVVESHRNVLHFVMNYVNSGFISPGDRITLLVSCSFSMSASCIYTALLSGAALHMLDIRQEGVSHLAEWLSREEITIFFGGSLFRQFAGLLTGRERFPQLRLIYFGGEPLYSSDVELFKRHFSPECLLVNNFGATEMKAFRQYFIDKETPITGGVMPIGYALADTEVLLLDDDGQPAAAGEAGEIAVKTRYLAPGYWRRPDLTAAKFLPAPNGSGERIYRTGDRGRLLPDGCLLHLGRQGSQVKIRGSLIDVGEVETALLQIDGILEAVVAPWEPASEQARAAPDGKRSSEGPELSDVRLAAYLVPSRRPAPTVSALRRALAQRLPAPMLPSVYVILDALPRNPNGKVDRRALPAPGPARPDVDAGYLAPRTPVETAVAGIWAELLGLERVGVNDLFLELGGDSLLAVRIITRVRALFPGELPIRQLFDAPTVASMAQAIVDWPAEQRDPGTAEILPGAPGRDAIIPRDSGAPAPLSSAQQRLWLLDRWNPGCSALTMSSAVRLAGSLHEAALDRSISEVVRRHESLRTTFVCSDGEPVQVIAPPSLPLLPVIDLSAYPGHERQQELQRRMTEAVRQPFDLASGPLFRPTLFRLSPEEHVLLFLMHHIIADGWSLGVLFRELSALYTAFAAGQPSPLPELPIQCADFAVWQRRRLMAEDLRPHLSYWKRQLDGAPGVLSLPTDRRRPAIQSFNGAREPFTFSPELTERLHRLCREEGATLYMLLLAAFQTLLFRWTGMTDLLVGTPSAGRDRIETEGLIGFFVNTLPLRADLAGDPPFRELLARVRDTALEAFAHQDVPFEKLVEELRPERDPGRSPLVQVLFTLQNTPPGRLDLPGLAVSPLEVDHGTAQHDITLSIRESEQGLRGALEYCTDLFDATTAQRMLSQYGRLLEAVVEEPDRHVSGLPLLTEAERHQLLAWGGGHRICRRAAAPHPLPGIACLHSLFQAQAERTPDAIAVTCDGRSLTYRRLNARANQLAHRLRKHGAGPDTLVALAVERSLDMVIGILGILKAGAAYVPLDACYPKERLAVMLSDAGADLLVTQEQLLAALPSHGARVICLDAQGDEIERESDENPRGAASPGNLAYVIYTSGSTGRPKGVMVTHANVLRLFEVTADPFAFDERDVWTLFHSVAFDFSVWEIWGALLHGGRLVIVPWEASRSPRVFSDLLRRERVTVLNQTPTAFRQWFRVEEERDDASGLSLRLVIFGGEALELAGLKPWFDRHGEEASRLVNMYGITETTVHVTCRPLTAADATGQTGSMIGGPLDDLELYVLDSHLQSMPIGIPGELYVGGAGLARGYLNRPDLTAERFVPHPLSDSPGERLYRTGDRARWRGDGDLEYLGRLDDQVKLRGFRIELGEIEAALTEHPWVRECAVAVRGGEDEQRLVAYLVLDQELAAGETATPPAEAEWRRFLREKLPESMQPAAYVRLEALPLTPQGKLDRRSLPSPNSSRPCPDESYLAPRNLVEVRLAKIWEEVLRVQPIGVRDDFFDLGGHSLLAARLFARIQRDWRCNLPLATLLQAPTIERLAERLGDAEPVGAWSPLVPIQSGGTRRPLYCVHGIGGNVLGYRELARHLGRDQPVFGIQAQGLDGRLVRMSIEEMAAHYVEAIRTYQPEGPYSLEGASFGGIVAFEMARQLQAAGHEVTLLALVDSYAPGLLKRQGSVGAARRVGGHLAAAQRLGPRGGFLYLVQRARGIKKRVEWRIWKARHREIAGQADRLPRTLRSVQLVHRRALDDYRPRAYPGRVTLFRAQERPVEAYPCPDRGWSALAAGGVEIHEVPGNHLTMLEEPHVAALAEALRRSLEAAERPAGCDHG